MGVESGCSRGVWQQWCMPRSSDGEWFFVCDGKLVAEVWGQSMVVVDENCSV